MTSRETVTDAAVEAMLARRAHRSDPVGLADALFAAIEATEPRRGPQLAWPAIWLPRRQSRGLIWVLVAATLLLALLGSALVGAGLLDRPRPPLSLDPNAIETLTPTRVPYDRVVQDGAGTHWAIGTGHLTRFDPGTGTWQTWTVRDDAAFASSIMAPARAGGVWIWSGDSIRRFTGDGFVESIPITAADQPTALVETPGGSLWAASWDRGLERWDGSRWAAEPAGRPRVAAGALLVRGEDDLWVSNPRLQIGADPPVGADPPADGVSHLEGGRWTSYDAGDAAYLGGEVLALEAVADGSIWVTTDPGSSNVDIGIARFDGQSWTVIDGPGFPAARLEVAADGSVWATGSGFAPAPNVARYADGHWTRHDAEMGLGSTDIGQVSATAAGVFLGTDVGLFRFADERWVPAWADASDGPKIDAIWDRVLAVSADEAWAAEKRGIWHFVDGTWTGPLRPPGWTERANGWALAPDGTLWVTTNNGVAALRGGQWTLAWKQRADGIAIGPDETAWAGAGSGIVGLRLDGSPPRTVACPNGSWAIAVTTDGSVYVGAWGWVGRPGLARFDGQTCERVDPLGGSRTVDVTELHAGPSGGLVAVMSHRDGSTPATSYLARLDGTRWTVLEEHTEAWYLLYGNVGLSPSGEIWRTRFAVFPTWERFDGERWIPVVTGVPALGPPSIAADGTLWFLGPSGVYRVRMEEARP
jgi:hypothetical protein